MTDFRLLFYEQAILIWRRKWLVMAICWCVCLIGWGTVMLLPRRYESDARIYVDVNGLLAPLLKGMVVDSTPSQSTEYLRQTLLSRPNLEKVIAVAGIAPITSSTRHMETLIAELQANTTVLSMGTNLISIAYENAKPAVARDVVQALVDVFAEEASRSSRVEMEKARTFLTSQLAVYDSELRAAEQRRAEFKKEYADYLPDSQSGAPRLDVLQQQTLQYQHEYDAAVVERDTLKKQMAEVPQVLSVAGAPTVSANGDLVAASPALRLVQAKQSLRDLRLQYTAQHPDVIAAQRMVTDLQTQVEAEPKSGGASAGKSQVPNPTYQDLKLKLVDAETAIPAVKQKLDDTTAQLNRVKAMAVQIPEIEAKWADLDRDYDIIKKNYAELAQRRESALLSQAADDQADRTQFRIIDPPLLPLSPSFPNLPIFFSLILVVGIGAGAAVPLVLNQLRPTFATVAQLKDLGLPVIGSVVLVSRKIGKFRLSSATVVAAACALLVCYGSLMLVATDLYRIVL